MSFVSLEFIIFIIISLILYYALPMKIRWIALLVASTSFYLMGGSQTISYLVFTTVITYLTARVISSLNEKNKNAKELQDEKGIKKIKLQKRLMVAFAAISNFGLLFFFKYWNELADLINNLTSVERLPILELVLPLGMSFYIFQSIGYVIDVYRGKYNAEKNILKYALFVSFFPQMVQGPISRYGDLGKQLLQGNKFSFDNVRDGIQLIMWGYLKKLVIADRTAIVVNQVFNNFADYDGGIILFGVIFYCIQLYCDFSGGIDITRGTAKLFGIDLTENFKRPIFATSLADFWRRWHISLGSWMKDYLFYPLSLSKPFIKLGKWVRNHIGGKAGKIIPVSIVTFIVYFAIGIWHGASAKYIVFGLWNGTLITISLLLEPLFIKIKEKLKIKNENVGFKIFQIARTSLLVLIGRYITRAGRFMSAVQMLKLTITTFSLKGIADGTLLNMGITWQDYVIILVGTIILLLVEALDEFGKGFKNMLNKKNFIVQWAVMMFFIISLFIFGIYRGNYIASEFIYKQF